MSADERELRAIVMDGPMPPAQEPVVDIPMMPPIPREIIGVEASLDDDGASLDSLGRREDLSGYMPVDPPPGFTNRDYEVVEMLVRTLHDIGLSNQVIVGVLQNAPAAVDMARTSLRLQAGGGMNVRNTYMEITEALQAIAGSPAAQMYLRVNLTTLTRGQSYDEIVQNQEYRRQEQERRLREQVAAARLAGDAPPSDQILERMVNRQARVVQPIELNHILVNQQTLADLRRFGRDEIDPETRREIMRNFDGVMPLPRLPENLTASTDAARVEELRLDSWIWREMMQRVGESRRDVVFRDPVMAPVLQRHVQAVFRPFQITATLTFTHTERMRLDNMNVALDPATRGALDIQRRHICGRHLGSNRLLMVFNEQGLFEFANYGQRPTTATTGDAGPSEADLRGRHGGSSSHPADGDPQRRARALNLDL